MFTFLWKRERMGQGKNKRQDLYKKFGARGHSIYRTRTGLFNLSLNLSTKTTSPHVDYNRALVAGRHILSQIVDSHEILPLHQIKARKLDRI